MNGQKLQKLLAGVVTTVVTKHNQSIDDALNKIFKKKGNLDGVEILSYESDDGEHITVVRCGNEEHLINTFPIVIVEG